MMECPRQLYQHYCIQRIILKSVKRDIFYMEAKTNEKIHPQNQIFPKNI